MWRLRTCDLNRVAGSIGGGCGEDMWGRGAHLGSLLELRALLRSTAD